MYEYRDLCKISSNICNKYLFYILRLRNIDKKTFNSFTDFDKYFFIEISHMLEEYSYIFSKKYNLGYPKKK